MSKYRLSRRQFLVGCSSAIAALAGSRLTQLAFAHPLEQGLFNEEVFIFVFLRGGWDALNVVMPIAGDDRGFYEAARPNIQVPASGEGAALLLDNQFGMHPSLGPLQPLYQAGKLALVHATGLTSDTRSHFDAMSFIELGTPGVKTTTSGWITRHLESATNLPDTIMLPAMSVGTAQSDSLLGSNETAALTDPDGFSLHGNWEYIDAQRTALRRLYTGNTWLYEAGTRTLNTMDLLEAANPGSYTPANGAVYPDSTFGNNLQVIAQMIKLGVGLRVATVDLGGWDTHESQGDGSGGYMAGLLTQLGQGMAALYTDLDGAGGSNYTSRLTMVVLSEFGRRLRQNANRGTDHGHGSLMFVLGGNVNGGKIYGSWPGLRTDQLYDGADLKVTTDYRQVLSEILVRRLNNSNLDYIFPGYSGYQPLGVVQGFDDLTQVSHVFLPQINKSVIGK